MEDNKNRGDVEPVFIQEIGLSLGEQFLNPGQGTGERLVTQVTNWNSMVTCQGKVTSDSYLLLHLSLVAPS